VLTLGNLSFFMRKVLAAGWTELLDFELVRHRALVLGGRVVRAAAVATRHFDKISHRSVRSM
jgi:hypothetical protein